MSVNKRELLSMSSVDARRFFLKGESYCTIDLPFYFKFDPLIAFVSGQLGLHTFREKGLGYPEQHDDVNYRILSNKDGKFSWRSFELINPFIYVSLVNVITRPANWSLIASRFSDFNRAKHITCKSIPVASKTRRRDRAVQILNWWNEIEQESIQLSLDYDYLVHTDISNFYPTIYTHAIPWALHTKRVAKTKLFRKDDSHVGNEIDFHLRAMSYGQTNGIPQGSVLMDFISEILLGAIDVDLGELLGKAGIDDIVILRYRDDYRIFSNNSFDSLQALKILSELLSEYGLKLNSSKTSSSQNVIRDSIKADKLFTLNTLRSVRNLQKRLLQILNLAEKFPECGSVLTELVAFNHQIDEDRLQKSNADVLFSILVELMHKNPKCVPVGTAILSKVIWSVKSDEWRSRILARIKRRFSRIPNTGIVELWLQRLSLHIDPSIKYEETLCNVVCGRAKKIWNNDWIKNKALRTQISAFEVVDEDLLVHMNSLVGTKEVDLFSY